MGDARFYVDHNITGYLLDPPEKFKALFNSTIIGLNTCSLAHAIRENPVTDKTLTNAEVIQQGTATAINSKIYNKEVIIIEK